MPFLLVTPCFGTSPFKGIQQYRRIQFIEHTHKRNRPIIIAIRGRALLVHHQKYAMKLVSIWYANTAALAPATTHLLGDLVPILPSEILQALGLRLCYFSVA